MAIKPIQLRGISRTPSDRMTKDGGLAESLNLYIDEEETAPMLPPEDVTETALDSNGGRLFPDSTIEGNPSSWEAVYIHKSPYFTRAIVKYEDEGQTKLGWVNDGAVVELLTLTDEETFVRGISIGNTLAIVTDKTVYWFLNKNGEYGALGNNIPFPRFTIAEKQIPNNISEKITSSSGWTNDNSNGYSYDHYINIKTPKSEGDLDQSTTDSIKEKINSIVSQYRQVGVFNYPHFAIFSVELFDGSSIISPPVLLGTKKKNPYRIKFDFCHSLDGYYNEANWNVGEGEAANGSAQGEGEETIDIELLNAYKPFVKINEPSSFFSMWSEIARKINIYFSEALLADEVTSAILEYISDQTTNTGNVNSWTARREVKGIIDINLSSSYDNEILNNSQFYLVASFNIDEKDDDFKRLFDGVVLDLSSTKTSGDNAISVMTGEELMSQSILDFSKADMKHYGTVFRNAIAFNDKLITSGISEEVRLSYPGLTATEYVDSDGAPQSQDKINGITFHCLDSSGRWFAISASINGDFSEEVWSQSVVIDGETKYPRPYAFIICPDVRAKYADISVHKEIDGTELDTVIRVEMKEHPFLDCSYWYGDISREIVDFETDADTMNRYPIQKNHQVSINGTTIDLYSYQRGGRSYTDVIPNKIYESEEANPFVFPLDGRHTFTGKVLGVAVATTALSTGQFGQFPLYVFTDDGIWALETGNDGSFVTSKPVSRDVCINPDSITTIDNAVVFVTEKGVMMISGSQVANLSENMNGKHFHLEEESGEYNLISDSDWSGLLPSISDDTHFMAFMREAFIVYDYTGNRLVFFKPDEVYQYVYYLKTATWHKMSFLSGRYAYPLSDYPDMFVNVKTDESESEQTRILEISSKKDVMSENNIPGILITRPMEFDLADVRKVIKDIRIRGGYERGHVKYILLGSFDGINWTVLRSLRGGSYKLFRMIVLTNLSVNERISWIDVDFDSRYNNKMR